MRVEHLESLILFVSDLAAAKAFYAGALGLPVLFEDQIIAVVGGESGRVVLHRDDRGHDERGIFPAGSGVGARRSASRLTIPMPASGMPGRRGSQWCGQSRTPRGAGSWSWLIPMAARLCSRR
jgi:catechol 2,3-dioxygenase-like lactoylglutathione lyase family enzyme